MLSNTPNAALGIARLTTANRVTIDTATGAVRNTRNTNTTVVNQVGGVNVYFDDFNVLPKEVVLDHGPAFPQTSNYSRGSVFVTHAPLPALSFELAANYQKSRHDNMQGRGYNTLQVDTTVTLPNGAPNPNAGRAFVDGFPGDAWSQDLTKDIRLSAAYQLDLGRLGTQQIAGLYQKDWLWRKSGQMRPIILTNPYNTSIPENGQNAVFFRTYYDLDGPPDQMTAGDWRRFDLDNITIDGLTRRAEFVNYIQGGQDNRFERDSTIGILQSHLLKNRLVTVVGYRIDWQDSYYSPTGFRGAPFGPFAVGLFETPRSSTPLENKATNLTYSGLFRVTDWLALTYNQARNSALPDPTAAIIGADGSQRPPTPRGESRDVGFKVNLDARLSLSAVYFETLAKKDLANVNNAIERRYSVIWDALAAAGVPAPGGGPASSVPSLFNRYTFDSRATGYELELIANPTTNWRVFLNFAALDLTRTHLGEEGRGYLARYREYWLQGNNGRIRTDGSGNLAPVANNHDAVIETVAETIEAVDNEIYNFYDLADGEEPRGQNKRRINMRTNYTFDRERLKGVSIGGGIRYRSPEVIAYEARTTSSGVEKNVIHGEAELLLDCNVGYRSRCKLGQHDIRWSVQLNVNNLLDETDIIPMRSVQGRIVDFRFQQPREVFLSTKFDF